MRLANIFRCDIFSRLDRSMDRLQEIRDSYRELNVQIYGEQLARMLNDW